MSIMNRNAFGFIYIIGLVCILAFVSGCSSPEPPRPKPKVVRKKIVVPEHFRMLLAREHQKPGQDTASVTPPSDQAEAGKKPDTGSAEPEKSPLPEKRKGPDDIEAVPVMAEKVNDEKAIASMLRTRLDPFVPLFRPPDPNAKPAAPAPEVKKDVKKATGPVLPPRRLGPLEKVDLSQLKLVGVIRSQSGNKALVEEASGKGYVITKGTYIGIRSGRVVDILPDRIIVEEEEKDVVSDEVTIQKRELKFQRAGEDYYEM